LDYTDLTPAETQIARRVMPFYVWTRKNTPRAVETIADNPQLVVKLDRTFRAMRDPQSPIQPFLSLLNDEGDGLRDEKDLPKWIEIPDWMRRSVPYPLRRNSRGEIEMAVTQNYFPIVELERFAPRFDQLGRTFLDMLSPGLKLLPETILRRNFFYDSEIVGQAEFNGIKMDARIANALHNIRLFDEFDRMNIVGQLGFTEGAMRPEVTESWQQTALRLATGIKIYPLDTNLGRTKNVRPQLRLQQRYNWQAEQALMRKAAKKADERNKEKKK